MRLPHLFTGGLQDIGHGAGRNHSINFPLRDGIDDDTFQSIFRPVRDRMEWCVCVWLFVDDRSTRHALFRCRGATPSFTPIPHIPLVDR